MTTRRIELVELLVGSALLFVDENGLANRFDRVPIGGVFCWAEREGYWTVSANGELPTLFSEF